MHNITVFTLGTRLINKLHNHSVELFLCCLLNTYNIILKIHTKQNKISVTVSCTQICQKIIFIPVGSVSALLVFFLTKVNSKNNTLLVIICIWRLVVM